MRDKIRCLREKKKKKILAKGGSQEVATYVLRAVIADVPDLVNLASVLRDLLVNDRGVDLGGVGDLKVNVERGEQLLDVAGVGGNLAPEKGRNLLTNEVDIGELDGGAKVNLLGDPHCAIKGK